MNAWLVTSAVTFVPKNYDGLVLPLAKDPHIQGLIVIDNRSWDIVFKALLLIISGAAPRMGYHLFKNFFDNSLKRKQAAYAAAGKQVIVFKDINAPEALEQIKALNADLLVNARTRSFFKKSLLSIPKMGCVNIHHGLLPDQRGLMCDFWAHLYKTDAGFSIHEMTSKLDDGALLKVQVVPSDKKDYLASLEVGAAMEATAVSSVLGTLTTSKIQGQENLKTASTVYRSNPKLTDFYRLRLRGTKL